MAGLWVIGVLLAVLASVLSNLGLNLQKKNHLDNEKKAAEVVGIGENNKSNVNRSGAGTLSVASKQTNNNNSNPPTPSSSVYTSFSPSRSRHHQTRKKKEG